MLLRKSSSADIPSSEITPQHAFEEFHQDRRRFLFGAAALGAGALAATKLPSIFNPESSVHAADQLQTVPGKFTTTENQTPIGKATNYNNFYEFGVEKDQPAKNAHTLQTRPWTVQVTGMVKKPQTVNIDDLLKYRPIENRVYRHRCVEAWSMVIPWDGYSLSEFINFCEPLPSAKYVQFISNLNRKQMPDLPGGYSWPYSEGLRMDEAMNPLACLPSAAMARCFPIRTAHRFASSHPGSTDSRTASPSSSSTSPTSSRTPFGTTWPPKNMASTPT